MTQLLELNSLMLVTIVFLALMDMVIVIGVLIYQFIKGDFFNMFFIMLPVVLSLYVFNVIVIITTGLIGGVPTEEIAKAIFWFFMFMGNSN